MPETSSEMLETNTKMLETSTEILETSTEILETSTKILETPTEILKLLQKCWKLLQKYWKLGNIPFHHVILIFEGFLTFIFILNTSFKKTYYITKYCYIRCVLPKEIRYFPIMDIFQ